MMNSTSNTKPELLSVIIPVYKVEQYLAECVDSVLQQSYPHMEIILVDDGSPDKSGQIADEYAECFPDKIRVIHKDNGGLSSARNAGLDIARGEFIGFLDSDDTILPGFYSDMIDALHESGADMGVSALLPWKGPRKVIPPVPSKMVTTNKEALEMLFTLKTDSSANTKIYRRSLIGDTRFIHGIINEDMPFLTEIYLRAKRVVYLPKGYYLYRVTPGSITNFFKPSFFDCLDNLERIRPMIEQADENVKDAYRFFTIYQHINSGIKIVRNKFNRKYKTRLRQNRRAIRNGLRTLLTHRASSPRMVGKAVFCFLHLPFRV